MTLDMGNGDGVIDSHHHLWDITRGYPWLDDPDLAAIRRTFTTADLTDELDANGISRTVLVEGGRCTTAEAYESLAIADAHDRIAGVVAWADVADPRLAETLHAYRDAPGGNKLVGIRSQIQGEADPDYLRRHDVKWGLATIAEQRLVFDLVVRADQLPAVADAAQAVPDATFVLDHLGKPPISRGDMTQWHDDLARVAAQSNVVAKLSGLVTEADWSRWTPLDLRPAMHTALDLFGPDRLMFGSDWPVCLLAATYRDVVSNLATCLDDLSASEQAAIWSRTAIATYRLT